MKLSTAHRLAIIMFTAVLHHTSSCMDVMVSIATTQNNRTQEEGKLWITVDPHTDTENSIIKKIIDQYTNEHNRNIVPGMLKITQANKIRTSLAQLIEEGLDIHKHLILRALIQVH